MARIKGTAINANPMPRKGLATTPKAPGSRPTPAHKPVKKPGKQATQQQPLASNQVASGRVKKGQAKPISKGSAKAPKKPARHPDNDDFDPDQEYKIKGIIDEKGGKYLIRWAGKDSDGGDFLDSWIPKSFANKLARLDWALRVEQNRRNSFNESDSESDSEEGEEVQVRGKQKKKTKAKTKNSTKAGAGKAKGKKLF